VHAPGAEPSASGRGPWLWLVAVVAFGIATAALVGAALRGVEATAVLARPGRGAATGLLLALARVAVATLAAGVAAGAVAVRRRRGPAALRPASTALLLRLSLYLAFAVMVAMLVADPGARFDERPEVAAGVGAVTLAGALLAVAAVLLARPRALVPLRPGWLHGADVAAFTVIAVGLAFEATLAILPAVSSSPLLQFDPLFAPVDDRHVDETLRRFRLQPNVQFFDGRANSRGYLDDEFFVAGPDDFVVAVVADSFGVGVVAPRYNVVAVLERGLQKALGGRFQRVAAHNFGVVAADFPEYYRTLVRDALPTRPALVVLCVFVGNDLNRRLRTPGAAAWAVLRNWRTYQLARRIVRLAIERGARLLPGGPEPPRVGWMPKGGALVDDLALPIRPRPLFLDIERQRLEICNTRSTSTELDYRAAEGALARFRDAAGSSLLVVIIPDELQVNDGLWAELLAGSDTPLAYDQTYPQQRLLASCRTLGIDALDLLPPLAEAQRSGVTYRPNDSHWSRLGNAVAGDEIAAAILRRPEASGRPR
jgi:hypothetical protein